MRIEGFERPILEQKVKEASEEKKVGPGRQGQEAQGRHEQSPRPDRPKGLQKGELERLREEVVRLQELLRERIREFLERHDLSLRYQLDRETGLVIAELIERGTGEVIRQVPSEEALRLREILGKASTTPEGGGK